jgi:hypothetical protein
MFRFLLVVAIVAGSSLWDGDPGLWSRFLSAEVAEPGGVLPDHSACVDPGGGGCASAIQPGGDLPEHSACVDPQGGGCANGG